MIRKLINRVNKWLEDKLRSIVRPLSPDARVVVILTMLLFFGGLSIYMTVSSIYNMGKKSGQQQMQIEHIKRLELEHKQEADSVKQLNDFNYE